MCVCVCKVKPREGAPKKEDTKHTPGMRRREGKRKEEKVRANTYKESITVLKEIKTVNTIKIKHHTGKIIKSFLKNARN